MLTLALEGRGPLLRGILNVPPNVLYHYTLFLRDVHEMHHEKKLYITRMARDVQLFFVMHFMYILKKLCVMVLSH